MSEIAERAALELAAAHSTKELSEALAVKIEEALEAQDIQPILDRVLVKPIVEPDWQKAGSLYVVGNDKPHRYLVIAVGPGRRQEDGAFQPPDCEPGDVVLAGAYIGHKINVKRDEYRLMKQSDILGIIEDVGGSA